MFNFGEYAEICHLPLASLKELHLISLTYIENLWLYLRGMINFPHMSHTNIVRRSEMEVFFSNIKHDRK